MQRPGAAIGDQRHRRDIDAVRRRSLAQGAVQFFVSQVANALRRLIGVHAQPVSEAGDRSLRRGAVGRKSFDGPGRDQAEHEVRVGERRPVAAEAGGPAGRGLRPDAQRAMTGDPHRRTAAGARLEDGDGRQCQVRAGNPRPAGHDRRAVENDPDRGRAAAHIQRERIAAAGMRRCYGGGGNARGGPGIERIDRRVAGMHDRHRSAVGARDTDLRRGFQSAQRVGKALEIAGERRAQHRRRHRGDRPLVIGRFPDDIAGQDDRHIGGNFADQRLERPLVRRVRRGVEQRNRDGSRTEVAQRLDRVSCPRFVDRLPDLTARLHALGNAEGCDDAAGQRARPLAAAEQQHMLEAGRDQQADGRTAGFRRVEPRDAVNDRRDIAGRDAGPGGQLANAAGDGGSRIVGAVRRLERVHRPGIVEQQQIRERLADIDTQTMGHGVFRHSSRAPPAGWRAGG